MRAFLLFLVEKNAELLGHPVLVQGGCHGAAVTTKHLSLGTPAVHSTREGNLEVHY